jgi:hypothetical protein
MQLSTKVISLQEEVNHLTSQLEDAQVEVDALWNTKVSLQSGNKNLIAWNKTVSAEKDRLKADLDALKGEVNLSKSSNQILLKYNASL